MMSIFMISYFFPRNVLCQSCIRRVPVAFISYLTSEGPGERGLFNVFLFSQYIQVLSWYFANNHCFTYFSEGGAKEFFRKKNGRTKIFSEGKNGGADIFLDEKMEGPEFCNERNEGAKTFFVEKIL